MDFSIRRELINNTIDNKILLIAKQYIYRTRCLEKTLSINALTNSIKEQYNIEKYISNGKGETYKQNFENEWKKWNKLLEIS